MASDRRLSAEEVVQLLRSAEEVDTVTTKPTKDGARATARITLRSGQRFYLAINPVAPIDEP